MKRLLGLLLALGLAAVATASDPVVCSATSQSDTLCSATSDSATTQLDCVCGSAVVAPSTLLTGLTNYWTLDESSAGAAPVSRSDSVGGATLTDNNTTASAAGQHNLAASFVAANNEWLSSTQLIPSTDTSFTISGWYNAAIDNSTIVSQWNDTGTNRVFGIFQGVSGAGKLDNYVADTGGALRNATVNSTLSTWHFFVAWYDATDKKSHVSIDGGATTDSIVLTGGRNLVNVASFTIGRQFNVTRALTGLVDEIGVWSRVLTPTERACLYNAGVGNFYPYTGVCTP